VNPVRRWGFFALLLLAAAAFIAITGQSLPDIVASHFNSTGHADGYMLRNTYLVFMGVVTVAVPFAIVVLQALMVHRPERLSLRNREYWLAPERREETLEFLNLHATRFAAMLVLLLCVVHWLLVKANAVQPAHLDSRLFITALVAFLVTTVVWLAALYIRFRGRG
jgi:uncharacterized membrane protein